MYSLCVLETSCLILQVSDLHMRDKADFKMITFLDMIRTNLVISNSVPTFRWQVHIYFPGHFVTLKLLHKMSGRSELGAGVSPYNFENKILYNKIKIYFF